MFLSILQEGLLVQKSALLLTSGLKDINGTSDDVTLRAYLYFKSFSCKKNVISNAVEFDSIVGIVEDGIWSYVAISEISKTVKLLHESLITNGHSSITTSNSGSVVELLIKNHQPDKGFT